MPKNDTQNNQDRSRRLIDAAVALLAAAPEHCMSAVQLNMALFYLDLAALKDHGAPVTGNTYLALDQGPVVARYKERLVGQLEGLGLAKQTDLGRSKPIHLVGTPEIRLDADSRKLAGKIAHWTCKKTATELSDFSHDNPGWRLAYSDREGRQPKPIDLLIAMQQIVDDDLWLDAELDPVRRSSRSSRSRKTARS